MIELRQTVRRLLRAPAFTFATVLTLALGLGATTAIFGVVYGVLLKPLPYPDADDLVSLRHAAPGHPSGLGGAALGTTDSMYLTYRQESRAFEQIGLWGDSERTLTGLGEPERIRTLGVTQGILQALGVQPLLGRWFSDAEHTTGAQGPDPVILSHAFWQRSFGGDEAALGRTLSLDSRLSQVVGVMPAGFRFLNLTPQPDVIIASRIDTAGLTLGNLNSNALARLEDGVTLADARADVARMVPIWLDAWPPGGRPREAVADWRVTPVLRPLKDDVVGGVGGMLWLLMGTVGAVLLIACANVANLLLTRADARGHELAIRAALGAGRRRIAGEVLRESLVLGALGGAVGLALAFGGLKLLAAFAPANLPRVEDIAVDAPVLAFAVAAALVSSLLFGSIPAARHALGSHALLGAGARGASTSRERSHTRNVLIVVQVALALVLLVGSGLMIRTFHALTTIDPGFSDPKNVQVARIFIPPGVMLEPERYTRAYRDILERIAALPGVTAAGFGGVPLGIEGNAGTLGPGVAIAVQDRPDVADELRPTGFFNSVSPGHLAALGTRVLAGRDLTWADIDDARGVVLVSENLARGLWGEPQAALGKRLRWESRGALEPWREIVGVTQNVYGALRQPPPPTVYMPVVAERSGLRVATYAIRSDRAGTATLINEVRQAVAASHPDLPVFAVRTLQDMYSDSFARTSFMLVLLAIAGAMALVLGLVGIYGVIGYLVVRRTRELGIRMALGAREVSLQRMLLGHVLLLVGVGLVLGFGGAAALTRLMESLLFGVAALDPLTYAAAAVVLAAAAALAGYLPARRVTRIDAASALRAE